jgi:hypothetical protein
MYFLENNARQRKNIPGGGRGGKLSGNENHFSVEKSTFFRMVLNRKAFTNIL